MDSGGLRRRGADEWASDGLAIGAFTVDAVATYDEAEATLAANRFDALVLDPMLLDGAGLDILASRRGRGATLPGPLG